MPVREDPDDRRVVGRVRALEAVAQPDGRRRLDRIDEDDRCLGDAELATGFIQCVERRLDVRWIRPSDPHPVGLDVHAQACQAAEVREGVPADDEGPVRRFEGNRCDATRGCTPRLWLTGVCRQARAAGEASVSAISRAHASMASHSRKSPAGRAFLTAGKSRTSRSDVTLAGSSGSNAPGRPDDPGRRRGRDLGDLLPAAAPRAILRPSASAIGSVPEPLPSEEPGSGPLLKNHRGTSASLTSLRLTNSVASFSQFPYTRRCRPRRRRQLRRRLHDPRARYRLRALRCEAPPRSAVRSRGSHHDDLRRRRAPCHVEPPVQPGAGTLRSGHPQLARLRGECGRVGGPEPKGPLGQRLDPGTLPGHSSAKGVGARNLRVRRPRGGMADATVDRARRRLSAARRGYGCFDRQRGRAEQVAPRSCPGLLDSGADTSPRSRWTSTSRSRVRAQARSNLPPSP